jgi:hypothetical protein
MTQIRTRESVQRPLKVSARVIGYSKYQIQASGRISDNSISPLDFYGPEIDYVFPTHEKGKTVARR